MIYLTSNFSEIVAYRITGEFVKKITVEELSEKVNINHRYINFKHWKENLFCANVNLSGKEQCRFFIFTLEGEIVKLFQNYVFFNSRGNFPIPFMEGGLYCYNDDFFYKQGYSDTLFRVSDQLELKAEAVFEVPGNKISENIRYQISYKDFTYIQVISVFENYIWMRKSNSTGIYLYAKKNNHLISFASDPFLQKILPLPDGTMRAFALDGLRNDIDGGLPFIPNGQIQNGQQMVCVYQSYLLKEKLTEEHFARYDIKDPEAHKRLRTLLTNLDWEDNPVLMIATFK